MILVCYGMPKSASTFAYQMAIGLLEAAGHVQSEIAERYLPEELRADFFDEDNIDLEALLAHVPPYAVRVIKTHARLESVGQSVFDPRVKAIVTARDPRDAILSAMDTAKRELKKARQVGTGFTDLLNFDAALPFYRQQMLFSLDWWRQSGFLKISYRELALQPYRAAERMNKYLALGVNSEAVVNYFLEDRSRIVEFSTGTIGRFREHFSNDQIAQMNDVLEKGIVMFA